MAEGLTMFKNKEQNKPENSANGKGSAVNALVSLPRRVNHRLAHLMGWNTGKIESWFKDGAIMVGFRCATCGKLEGVHMARQFRKGKVN